MLTPKHLEYSSKPPPEPEPVNKIIPYTTEINDDFEDLKVCYMDTTTRLSREIACVNNELWQLKRSLEESKREINELKNQQPTLPPPSHTPPHDKVSWQASEDYKADVQHPLNDTSAATCNPSYIRAALDMDPKYYSTPSYKEFFSINNDHVHFEFDEFDKLKDVADRGRQFVIDHILKFIKKTIADNITLPFVYRKGTWYINSGTGWEPQTKAFNKGLKPSDTDYRHDEIKTSLIFILQNRFNNYCDEKYNGSQWGMSHDATRIITEVFRREAFTNKELMYPLIALLNA
tara:strand:+ start:5806 stop:6675 length:870 start_codon:yes stop_codon:yes gene_type:complete